MMITIKPVITFYFLFKFLNSDDLYKHKYVEVEEARSVEYIKQKVNCCPDVFLCQASLAAREPPRPFE